MKNLLILLVSIVNVVFLWSCNKETELAKTDVETVPAISTKNGRLVFQSTDIMKETYSALNSGILDWEKQYNYSNLQSFLENLERQNEGELDSISLLKYGLIPKTMINFLNDKCEMQIGDTIIWINANYEYLITNGDEVLLSKVKNLVNNGNLIPSLKGLKVHEISKIAFPSNLEQGNQSKSLYGAWLDASYQDIFTIPGNDHTYKIVHETLIYQWDG